MTNVLRTFFAFFAAITVMGIGQIFLGCDEEPPLQTTADNSQSIQLSKMNSETYSGDVMATDGDISFLVHDGALTMPEYLQGITDVDVEMSVEEQNDGQIFFTFSPSGSQFNPPAEIHMDWAGRGSVKPGFYFIDELGNFIEQPADDVELQDEHLKIYIHHFSRYAVDPD